MKIFNLLLVLSLASCTKTATINNNQESVNYYRDGKVNFLTSNKGLLTFSSEGTAEKTDKATYHAEINALENLLFKGIQGSPQENPLISDEGTALKENPTVLKNLIFNYGYKAFLTESQILETFKGNTVTVVQRVTFDIPALRIYLEKNNIIRKFGL